MTNFNLEAALKAALDTDERVWADETRNELNKSKLLDLLEKTDHKIISALFKQPETQRHFFVQIGEAWVFKMQDFRFFLDKHSVNNSYTRYANRIGLTDGTRFLKDSSDVVLDFPFKDCVLNGGQSTEEGEEIYFERNKDAQLSSILYTKKTRKRQEIFFNQILAFDEIDRLFSPKALSQFSRYTSQGKQSVGTLKRHPDGTLAENLIIKGNNLIALHTLATQFKGKVKLIYIDPPYNTGNDGFKYNDKFTHSTWLTFMKNRLEIARQLLDNDGFIFVQCDYRENSYLRILMDEVFGRENFVNEITWKKYGGVKNQSTLKLTTQQETIYLYSKTENFKINKVYNPLSEKHIKNEYKYVDENGRRYAKLRGRSYQNTDGAAKIKYLDENLGSPITTLWVEEHLQLNTSDAEKLKDFTGQKPETLIQRIIELSTEPNDIVLDYHLGSGTTAAVAHKMNRQYIGIEQMDYIETLAVERLKKVIEGEQGGISKAVNWQGGGDFIYCELTAFNETAKKIQTA